MTGETSLYLFLTCVLLTPALQCPNFSCAVLSPNQCAQKQSGLTVILNAALGNDSYCSASSLFNWASTAADLDYLQSNSTVSVNATDYSKYDKWPCNMRDEYKDMYLGGEPKECSSDLDCRLEDSTLSKCECTLRNNTLTGICHPDFNSGVFESYWTLCGDTGTIANTAVGVYWDLFYQYYPYVLNSAPCASGLFEENQLVTKAKLASVKSLSIVLVATMSVFAFGLF